MRERFRSRRVVRAFRFVVVSSALVGAAACAAVLGIDDRQPELTTGTDGGTDAPVAEGSADGPIVIGDGSPGADADAGLPLSCDPTACKTAGGTCSGGACAFSCPGSPGCASTITCPPGNDCNVACTASAACNGLTCAGGKSCTIGCTAKGSCTGPAGVTCTSARCDFQCTAQDSCMGKPLSCNGAVCNATCSGSSSCDKGVDFVASTSCAIACSGSPSCAAGGALVRCVAPAVSIDCANVKNACQNGKPECFGPAGSTCSIECGDTTSCGANYCCEAGTCTVDAAMPRANKCP